MAYPEDNKKLGLAPTFESGLKPAAAPAPSPVYDAVANNPLIDVAKKSGNAVALGVGINQLARDAGTNIAKNVGNTVENYANDVTTGAKAVGGQQLDALKYGNEKLYQPLVNLTKGAMDTGYAALTGDTQPLTQKQFNIGLPKTAEIGVPAAAAQETPAAKSLQGPMQQPGMMVQYGPEPAPRTNIPTTPGLPPGYAPPPSAEKIATQAQLRRSNANDAAQRNLAGDIGTTTANGYTITGSGADRAAFNEPTGVNAGSMAAMKAQFNQMNAGSGSGPTRTPSLHADENLAGVPKMMTQEERRAAGIGWKTGNAMYKEQMDVFRNTQTNKSALEREKLSQEGATGRTGMQEAGATNRTGMQNANAVLTTGMNNTNTAGIAANAQAGENQRLGTTIGANEAAARNLAANQARGDANRLTSQAIIQGVDPARARVDVGGNNELQTNNLQQVPTRGESNGESFTGHVVNDPAGIKPPQVVYTGNRGTTKAQAVPENSPAGTNLAGPPQQGGTAQTANTTQKAQDATGHISMLASMGDETSREAYLQQLRTADPTTYAEVVNRRAQAEARQQR